MLFKFSGTTFQSSCITFVCPCQISGPILIVFQNAFSPTYELVLKYHNDICFKIEF